jgi:hypothetical protein
MKSSSSLPRAVWPYPGAGDAIVIGRAADGRKTFSRARSVAVGMDAFEFSGSGDDGIDVLVDEHPPPFEFPSKFFRRFRSLCAR